MKLIINIIILSVMKADLGCERFLLLIYFQMIEKDCYPSLPTVAIEGVWKKES